MSIPAPNTSFRGVCKKVRSKRKYVCVSSPEIATYDIQHQYRKHKRLNTLKDIHGKVKSSVAIQAKKLQSRLDQRFPSFIKSLLKSHVTGGFWLGLPAPFSRKHLPQEDTYVTLETQSKKPHKAKYLVRKTGLSGGWKEFAVSENLLVGDVLVFHLLSATKFKVYIIKGNSLADVEGALFTLNLDSPAKKSMVTRTSKGKDYADGDQKTLQPPSHSKNNSSTDKSITSADLLHKCKEAAPSCNGVSTFDDFSIVINDLLKDYELPQHIKSSYYRLCCSQNELLHANLPKSMNNIFVGGTIIETVTVANALRECELSTSKDEFTTWDATLNALELIGMNVGFLRARLRCLEKIVHDEEVAISRQKCAELCFENARDEDEIRSLKTRLAEMKKVRNKRAADISNLKSKVIDHELKFKEQVHAPW